MICNTQNIDCEYRHKIYKICILNDSERLDCCPTNEYKVKVKGNEIWWYD